jgi:hypothetical protein
MTADERLSILQRDLRSIFGDRLESLVAYGAPEGRPPQHEETHGASTRRVHSLAIVETLSEADLRHCGSHLAGWHDAGCATPVFLASHEFERALDTFPREFGAILTDHVLVAGRNPFEGLRVDPADLRRACEVQARSHLLHLREGYVETRGNGDALAVLIVRSAPPFAALLKSVAALEADAPRDRAAAARHLERVLQVDPGSISAVAALVDATEVSAAEAVRIFGPYLAAVERLVKYVDGWSGSRR